MNRYPDICYFCGTSLNSNTRTKEHVPPKCFFPEEKYSVDGVARRKNLITVPSCKIHNNDKSNDDMYLWSLITFNFISNNHGQSLADKAIRALLRDRKLAQKLLRNQREVWVKEKDTDYESTIALDIDHDRVDRSLEMLVKAIYFYEFSQVSLHKLIIFKEFIVFSTNSIDLNYRSKKRREKWASFFTRTPVKGENPEIFSYQIEKTSDKYPVLIRLKLYEENEVVAAFQKIDTF